MLDVKRGDIGSTAQAYADAYLDPRSPMAVDAITATPFLGFGSLEPMLGHRPRARQGRLRARADLQPRGPAVPARPHRGRAARWPAPCSTSSATLNADAAPMGSFGAVVGATIAETDEDLDVNGPLLVPGIGAQGGTADDVRRIFGGVLDLVLPSSSREILGAGPDAGGPAGRPSAASLDAFSRPADRPLMRRGRSPAAARRCPAAPARRLRRPDRGLLQRPAGGPQGVRGDARVRARPSALLGNLPMLHDLAEKSPGRPLRRVADLPAAPSRGWTRRSRTPGSKPSDFDGRQAAGRAQRGRPEGDRRRGQPDHDRGGRRRPPPGSSSRHATSARSTSVSELPRDRSSDVRLGCRHGRPALQRADAA